MKKVCCFVLLLLLITGCDEKETIMVCEYQSDDIGYTTTFEADGDTLIKETYKYWENYSNLGYTEETVGEQIEQNKAIYQEMVGIEVVESIVEQLYVLEITIDYQLVNKNDLVRLGMFDTIPSEEEYISLKSSVGLQEENKAICSKK